MGLKGLVFLRASENPEGNFRHSRRGARGVLEDEMPCGWGYKGGEETKRGFIIVTMKRMMTRTITGSIDEAGPVLKPQVIYRDIGSL